MRHLIIALVCLVLLVPVAYAGPNVDDARATMSTIYPETDKAIAPEVAKQIRRYPLYSIFDEVQATVHDGVVVLTGKVTMPYKASEIQKRVARVSGVREVDNKIQTLPVSMFDDGLRATIARQIYRDPLFWNYAIQVNPPIHVIVEHGRVTLSGVVGSEVDRRKAEMIARTTPNVFSVENKLRLDAESES
jgi:osmotically-inducible protein OsmY